MHQITSDIFSVNLSNDFPDELTLNILSYLSARDLVCCESVCNAWKAIVSDRSIWSSLLSYKYGRHNVESCASLISKLGLSPKQAYRYFPLLLFLVQSYESDLKQYVVYGGNKFYITPEGGLEYVSEGSPFAEVVKFDVAEDSRAVKLALEDDFLFVFYDTGKIFKWNWRTKEHVSTFQAKYSEISYFLVQDGLMILQYRDSPEIEIISHIGMQEHRFIHLDYFKSVQSIVKRDNYLWFFTVIEGKDFIFSLNYLNYFNYSKKELDHLFRVDGSITTNDMLIQNDRVFLYGEYTHDAGEQGCIYILDHKGQVLKVHTFNDLRFNRIAIFGNLLIGAEFSGIKSGEETKPFTKIAVIDIETGAVLGVVDPLHHEETDVLNEVKVGELLSLVS